jgi:hypothetical protein
MDGTLHRGKLTCWSRRDPQQVFYFLLRVAVFLVSTSCLSVDYSGKEGPLSEISTVQGIRTLVANHPEIQSIEALIGALPKPLLSSPVFVYQSQSLQGASLESPRVLLSDGSGNLVLAFNGDARQSGYDRLEAMEFNEQSARFTFYELSFSGKGNLEVSQANPERCLKCHREPDPRPNWESYDQWPGVYAGNDDRLIEHEVEPFKKLIQTYSSRPRYRYLQLDYLKPILQYTSFYGRLPEEPNISLTHRLSKNNFKRVARLITESQDYSKFKYALGAFLGNYSGIPNELPIDFFPENFRKIFSYYSQEEIEEAQSIANTYGQAVSYPHSLIFRSFFESRGMDTSDWFMNFKGGLGNTLVNGVPWQPQLLVALLDRDAELKSFLWEGSQTQFKETPLIETSLSKFKTADSQTTLSSYKTDSKLPKKIWRDSCRQCHEVKGPHLAPQFSFETCLTHKNLRELIESGRMPKNQKLTRTQKVRFLEAIGH